MSNNGEVYRVEDRRACMEREVRKVGNRMYLGEFEVRWLPEVKMFTAILPHARLEAGSIGELRGLIKKEVGI